MAITAKYAGSIEEYRGRVFRFEVDERNAGRYTGHPLYRQGDEDEYFALRGVREASIGEPVTVVGG